MIEYLEIMLAIFGIIIVVKIVRMVTLLYALNVFLVHFGRTKIPFNLKTLFAAAVMRNEIKNVLTKASI